MADQLVFMDEPEYSVARAGAATVYRMMDLAKFNSVLARGAVAFSRADKFEDHWEARLTPRDWHAQEAFIATTNAHSREMWDHMTYEQKIESVRKVGYVNCWYRRQIESNLMWGHYGSQRNNGVAIRSTIQRLGSCFDTGAMYIGKVRYLDFAEAENENWPYQRQIAETDLVRYFFQKRRQFADEREVRIVYRQWLQGNFEPPSVGYMPCDLKILIQRVYVAPGSGKWFRDDVATLLKQYGIHKPVEHSQLDDMP